MAKIDTFSILSKTNSAMYARGEGVGSNSVTQGASLEYVGFDQSLSSLLASLSQIFSPKEYFLNRIEMTRF